jgi:NitT/TauT family transport system permease protein
MIEATGGCWNAAIVAEYVDFSGHTYTVTGLGSLITLTSQEGNYPLLLASTLTMATTVVAINRSCWRRLYRRAEEKYRLD